MKIYLEVTPSWELIDKHFTSFAFCIRNWIEANRCVLFNSSLCQESEISCDIMKRKCKQSTFSVEFFFYHHGSILLKKNTLPKNKKSFESENHRCRKLLLLHFSFWWNYFFGVVFAPAFKIRKHTYSTILRKNIYLLKKNDQCVWENKIRKERKIKKSLTRFIIWSRSRKVFEQRNFLHWNTNQKSSLPVKPFSGGNMIYWVFQQNKRFKQSSPWVLKSP